MSERQPRPVHMPPCQACGGTIWDDDDGDLTCLYCGRVDTRYYGQAIDRLRLRVAPVVLADPSARRCADCGERPPATERALYCSRCRSAHIAASKKRSAHIAASKKRGRVAS